MMAQLISFLLLLALPASIIAEDIIPGFWSIDCGATSASTNKNGIPWVPDSAFVHSGERRALKNPPSDLIVVLKTLRVFTTKTKNCFTIPVPKGTKIDVTAKFYYGNYDGLAAPPTFDVYFDSNFLTTMSTTLEDAWRTEVVYVTRRKGTSICLVRTNINQYPFVNAIEVRTLKPDMYAEVNSSVPLIIMRRFDYGGNATIRYPYDQYDREWIPNIESFPILRSNATAIQTLKSDDPPELVLRTAVAPPRGLSNLNINMSYLSENSFPIYFLMFFSEVTDLAGSAATRSFNIYMDKNPISSAPIVPPFQGVARFTGLKQISNRTVFTLMPTPKSTLPPIINAMEVFLVSDKLVDETDVNDVSALAVLQDRFQVLQGWSGDPCLPENYNWDWVGCSSDDSPRITQLYLSGYGLSGPLPDFGSLDALYGIYLDNNSLVGPIPAFLGDLPNLKILNLAYNNLSDIPNSLCQKAIYTNLTLNISGNPLLHCAPKNGSNKVTLSKFSFYLVFFLLAVML